MYGKKPEQIASYETIVHPFDGYVWLFTIISMMAQFLALYFMQNIWSLISGRNNPRDYIFEGLNNILQQHSFTLNYNLTFFRYIPFNNYDSKEEAKELD